MSHLWLHLSFSIISQTAGTFCSSEFVVVYLMFFSLEVLGGDDIQEREREINETGTNMSAGSLYYLLWFLVVLMSTLTPAYFKRAFTVTKLLQ